LAGGLSILMQLENKKKNRWGEVGNRVVLHTNPERNSVVKNGAVKFAQDQGKGKEKRGTLNNQKIAEKGTGEGKKSSLGGGRLPGATRSESDKEAEKSLIQKPRANWENNPKGGIPEREK